MEPSPLKVIVHFHTDIPVLYYKLQLVWFVFFFLIVHGVLGRSILLSQSFPFSL